MRAVRRIAPLVAAAAALVCLFTYALLGWYSRWIADDFCTAAAMKAEGFWRSQATMYRTWSGRYVFTFVMNVVESFGPAAARVIPALTIAAWIAAASFAARRLLRTTWTVAIAVAITFVYAAIDGAPDAFQSLLWQTGALTYLAPMILLTLWSGSLARNRVNIAAAAIAFLAGAFSETSVVCQVTALTVALIVAPADKRRIIAVALVASLAALAIVATAPGNAIRREQFPPPGPLAATIERALTSTASFIGEAIVRNGLALLLVVMVVAICTSQRPATARPVLAMLLAMIAATAAAFFTAIQMTADNTPGRALVVPETLLVATAAIAGLYVPRRFESAAALLAIALAAMPAISASRNIDLLPAARSFARTWDRMDLDLRAASGDQVVDMPETVGTLYFVKRDPTHWTNRCVARYYGLTSVRSR